MYCRGVRAGLYEGRGKGRGGDVKLVKLTYIWQKIKKQKTNKHTHTHTKMS